MFVYFFYVALILPKLRSKCVRQTVLHSMFTRVTIVRGQTLALFSGISSADVRSFTRLFPHTPLDAVMFIFKPPLCPVCFAVA